VETVTTPSEYTLVEKPIIGFLQGLGYTYLPPSRHPKLRGTRENEVLFRPLLIEALCRINGIGSEDARAITNDLARTTDNQSWISILRGKYSRKLPGDTKHRTIRVVDFNTLANNHFHITNQLRVQGEVVRKPDLVVYLNGIPIVVIEAKSPINPSQNTWDAVDQVCSAEREVPRLFHTNLFNIATNDVTFRYGASGAPREFWFRWRDPWPRKPADFATPCEAGLWSLLEPSRLLDLLAHFIIFESRDGKTIKKICRYQQYRAVNKMVARVVDGRHQQGLIWHTQGSGKSLTMVFAVLKLRSGKGVDAARLQSPNIMVLTDRKDLDEQISKTFEACGLPHPQRAGSIAQLRAFVRPEAASLVLLSTIFKFQQDDIFDGARDVRARQRALKDLEVQGSERWILMVDECHRTQEKDLGAYMRAVLPRATRFGFTGTPVKKGDHDTYANFGVPGEGYLDRYCIDDAVADGATVPIFYMGQKTKWHLHDKEADIAFEQWFANEPEEVREELKRRGVTKGDLARFGPRINDIALAIWTHYRAHVMPDGFKAQIVAIDRLACVAYKEALDRVIAKTLRRKEGLDQEGALAKATTMSACIYSASQHDGEHDHRHGTKLTTYQVDEQGEKQAIKDFNDPDSDLRFLIVCNKLLTGFDAPIEQAMYLDNPLTDHNLLQAIARTNRRYGAVKRCGFIVDYIGISKGLAEALSAYRKADVQNAMRPLDELRDQLRIAHRQVMALFDGMERTGQPREDALAATDWLGTEDRWYDFRAKAKSFMDAYGELSPDPTALAYKPDLQFIGSIMPYGMMCYERRVERDWKAYSEKIREILDEHLDVTGLTTVCTLRSLSDAGFWEDFAAKGKDLEVAAVRKLAELKKITTERTAENAAQYETFSERVKALIKAFDQGLIDAARLLTEEQAIARAIAAEDKAYQDSGLNRRAHAVWKILEKFKPPADLAADGDGTGAYGGDQGGLTPLQEAAVLINELYASDQTAPAHWHERAQLRKELLRRVRRIVHPLGLTDWREVARLVDEYAGKHYPKP
jgi:type I restriction enzyme R subunit